MCAAYSSVISFGCYVRTDKAFGFSLFLLSLSPFAGLGFPAVLLFSFFKKIKEKSGIILLFTEFESITSNRASVKFAF